MEQDMHTYLKIFAKQYDGLKVFDIRAGQRLKPMQLNLKKDF